SARSETRETAPGRGDKASRPRRTETRRPEREMTDWAQSLTAASARIDCLFRPTRRGPIVIKGGRGGSARGGRRVGKIASRSVSKRSTLDAILPTRWDFDRLETAWAKSRRPWSRGARF